MRDKFLNITWGPSGCQPPKQDSTGGTINPGSCTHLTLTALQPEHQGWILGKIWGVRYWEPGKDRGGLIKIQKEPAPKERAQPIGPNVVINEESEINKTQTDGLENTQDSNTNENSLWTLMNASYQVINRTYPNLTLECWLCFDPKPPYFEAIGLGATPKLANGTNPDSCKWSNETQGISLQQVRGKGICIGKVPPEKQHLCMNRTCTSQWITRIRRPSDWIIPVNNSKWICSKSGLTPCVSMKYIKLLEEFCIQVIVIPKITYHPKGYEEIVVTHQLVKREPVTALTVGALLALSAVGAGTGIASIVSQNHQSAALRVAVDEDLLRIEQSISALEKSVRSLSEVVLQNR